MLQAPRIRIIRYGEEIEWPFGVPPGVTLAPPLTEEQERDCWEALWDVLP